MVIERKVWVQPLAELHAHFTEAKLHLFGCEVVANCIPHHAEKALDIVSCACSGVLRFSALTGIESSAPLPPLNIGDHSNQSLS